jgi:Flp pilus assembly protein TadG
MIWPPASARVAPKAESGQAAVVILILSAFVFFGFLGLAVDLGRLYLIRGELNTAAEAMALAGAGQLIGTTSAGDRAQAAMAQAQSGDTGFDNRFNFAGNRIGAQGFLTSQVEDPLLFATYADALNGDPGAAVGSTAARYIRVAVRADAPLTFWQFLPTGKLGKTSIETAAVAGISQPLCVICGMEPLAIAPQNANDAADFGFLPGQRYTFYSQCAGPAPPPLAGAPVAVQYTILNRTPEDTTDIDQQVFELLAGGIPAPSFPASSSGNLACPAIGAAELRLPAVSVSACSLGSRGTIVTDTLCGLNARLNPAPHAACASINNVDTLIQSFPPDTDTDSHDTYQDYSGNRRRILTVAIVNSLPFAAGAPMNVFGFRQFLLEPNPGTAELNPADAVGRFVAMYIGSPVPVKQGQFGSCGVTQGPGKVVLHQ